MSFFLQRDSNIPEIDVTSLEGGDKERYANLLECYVDDEVKAITRLHVQIVQLYG